MPAAFYLPETDLEVIIRSGGGQKDSRKRIYAKYTEGKSTDVKQPLPIPMNVSEWAIGNGYTVGSEPGSLLLVLLMAAALLLNVLYQNSKKKPAFSKERAQDEK